MLSANTNLDPNRFYVYALYDGYVPFYVGKGTRDRIKKHIKIAHDGSKLPVHNKIRKMNYKHQERILADGLTDSDALELEELTIITVGRRDLKTGPLLNLTNGGEGPAASMETRRRLSESHKGIYQSKKTRAKRSKSSKGRTHTNRARKLLSESLMGHPVSEETRAKISATKKSAILNDEQRKKFSDAGKMSKGRKHSVHSIQKMSESKKGHTVSQATRDKISKTLRARHNENRA